MNVPSLIRMVPCATSPLASDIDHPRDILTLLGTDAGSFGTIAPFPIAVRRLMEGGTLAHEGAPLRCLYVVRCGSFKCLRTLEDGYEQVTALALPGDVLGFEGLHCRCQPTTDIALEISTVYALPLESLQALRGQWPPLDDAWQRALSRQLARAAATTYMLAAVASDVRLARFILWLSARTAALGRSPSRLRLSLNRRDLASLLGMAHETVSRSFSILAEAGLLKVCNREIGILNHARLSAHAKTTRRPADTKADASASRSGALHGGQPMSMQRP